MKLQVPIEMQFFSRFRLKNFLTEGGRGCTVTRQWCFQHRGNWKTSSKLQRSFLQHGSILYSLWLLQWSEDELQTRLLSSFSFFLKATNSACSIQTSVAAVAQPLLPCPCAAACPQFYLLGILHFSSAQPGKHCSNFCRCEEGRSAPLARSQPHPALPNQHPPLPSAFRHFINHLHLTPAELLYPDLLPINQ